MTSLNLNIDSTKRHKNVWSISIKKIRYSLILLLLNFILFLFLYFIDCEYKKWISYFAISLIISIFFNFLILRKNRTNMLSFISLWIIILYLFCFGQVFLYGFFPNYVATKTNYLFPESENIKRALYFSYWVINFIFVGAIFSSKKSIKFTEISRKSYKTIMLIFLIIFIPLQAYYVLKNISIARTYGYEEVLHSGFSGVYAQLASLYLIGASMLIVFTRKHKTYNAIIYIIELLFIFISMFSGSRIYFVSAAIVITYIFLIDKKITVIKAIIGFVVLLILLQFVSTISIVRSSPGIDLSTFFSSFLNLKNNVILMVLEEFGCSIYSVILPMEQVPSIVGYGMGNSYIKSIPLFLVNLPGIDIQKYMADSCYINHLQGTLSMGGHIIGELYYNFGSFFSLFFALIIGIIIGRLSYIFELLFKTKVNVTSLFYIMVMHSLIVWIRDYFSCLIRPIIWGAIIIVIINLFINNSRVKKRVIIYAS